jgi:hypothetical protein
MRPGVEFLVTQVGENLSFEYKDGAAVYGSTPFVTLSANFNGAEAKPGEMFVRGELIINPPDGDGPLKRLKVGDKVRASIHFGD